MIFEGVLCHDGNIKDMKSLSLMVKARKRFGQNFLNSPEIINKMLEMITQSNPQRLLEIGPGLGALTFPLVSQNRALHAIELDRDLIDYLEDKSRRYPSDLFSLEQGDVLDKNLNEILQKHKSQLIISNLPYNISTPFFLKLVFDQVAYEGFFLVQKEVAKRLTAQAGQTHYGRLTVMINTCFQAHSLFDVPSDAFSPAPKVQSTFFHLKLKKDRFTPCTVFEKLIRDAFSERRKKISNTLKDYHFDFESLNIDSNLRPQDLTLEDYQALYSSLKK